MGLYQRKFPLTENYCLEKTYSQNVCIKNVSLEEDCRNKRDVKISNSQLLKFFNFQITKF